MSKKFLYLFLPGMFFSGFLSAMIYQAENADLFKAVHETKNAGYLGESYINFENEPGSYLELRIGLEHPGEQTVQIRFSNGGANTRPMKISVNGTDVIDTLLFHQTGSWINWDTAIISLYFPSGISLLRFTSTGSEGGPNIDQIEISGNSLPAYSLNLTVVGRGSIGKYPKNGLLFKGQKVLLTARPDYASEFVKWSGDLVSGADSLEFVMDSNKNIQAVFNDIQLKIPEPNFTMQGYASVPGDGFETTTGGQGGALVFIETLQQLKNWGANREDNNSPETAIIKGTIEAKETEVITIKRGGNISILGDTDSEKGYGELINVSINIRDYSNVIVRNLKMSEVLYPNDDLTIDNCNHVWIDHCEFYSKTGPGIGVDTYDGLLDIKKGSHRVTVSWCYFHHHMKTLLMGHSDNNGEQDVHLEATLHHNWFSHTDGRNPSLRFGKVHYFNNYLENITDYGFAVRNGAHAKIENCHFESVKIPVATDKFEGHGFACLSGCIFTGSCTESDVQISEPVECFFWNDKIPYYYELENVQTVSLSVQKYAGVGKINQITSLNQFSMKNEFEVLNIHFSENRNAVFFTLHSKANQNLLAELYSVEGKRIFAETIRAASGSQQAGISFFSLKTGVYILNVVSSSQKISEKLVIK